MLKLAGLATAAALAAFAAVKSPSSVATFAPEAGPSSSTQAPEPNLELRGALARAGLGPEELTAAGIPAARISALIARAGAHSVVASSSLGPADASLAEASTRVASLEEAVRGGARDAATMAALTAARADAATAKANVDGLLAALFVHATQEATPAAIARLQAIASNQRYRRLPIEFLVVERGAAQWAELKECLKHERVCTRRGDPTDPTQMAALGVSRAHADVAAAHARGEANMQANEAAWLAATTL